MTASINGVTIPLGIRDLGSYVYTPYSDSVENGLGETITSGLPSVTWTFGSMEPANFAWLTTTLLGGALFLRSAAVLPTDLDVELAWSSVVTRRPTYSRRMNGRYLDVVVRIDTMVYP